MTEHGGETFRARSTFLLSATSSLELSTCRDRAEARKLKRLVSKERRGAMRELRKDATFMGIQSNKEKEEKKSQNRKTLRSNSAWLQKLEQDFKSGGQGGLWKKKRKK